MRTVGRMTTPSTTTEIEVELENEPGTLADVSEVLADERINILGFACVAQGQTGTACFITDDPDASIETLKAAGFTPRTREAVFVPTPNEPGQLADLSRRLGDSAVNIERSFVASDERGESLGIGFEVDDTQQALKVLEG